MESNEDAELMSETETDSQMENRMTATGRGGQGVKELSKKEKGLMNMDNNVLITGRSGVQGINCNGKNTIYF